MLRNLHSRELIGTRHVAVHDMIADETLQGVDTIREVLELPSLLQVVTMQRIARTEHWVIELDSQVVERMEVAFRRIDAILLELSTIDRVGLYESREAVLLLLGHPTHLRVDVRPVLILRLVL